MLLVILHRVYAVEWKGRVEAREHGRLSHLRDFRCHLVGEKVTAQSRLCSLSILELDNRCVLYRLFSDAEHASGNLSNHVVPVGHDLIWVTTFTRRSKGLKFPCSSGPSNHEVEIDRHYPRRPSQPLHDVSIPARRSRLLSLQSCTLDHSLEPLPSAPAHTSPGSARQSTACSPNLLARHTSGSATLRGRGESVPYASRG